MIFSLMKKLFWPISKGWGWIRCSIRGRYSMHALENIRRISSKHIYSCNRQIICMMISVSYRRYSYQNLYLRKSIMKKIKELGISLLIILSAMGRIKWKNLLFLSKCMYVRLLVYWYVCLLSNRSILEGR
jgi:hypothetical protein